MRASFAARLLIIVLVLGAVLAASASPVAGSHDEPGHKHQQQVDTGQREDRIREDLEAFVAVTHRREHPTETDPCCDRLPLQEEERVSVIPG